MGGGPLPAVIISWPLPAGVVECSGENFAGKRSAIMPYGEKAVRNQRLSLFSKNARGTHYEKKIDFFFEYLIDLII